ncbi:hypothetical protein ALI144C_01280 [Actinosynnema sp. ALI-1.44]|nr:hypothetical protein ALI144C_01280 [Actinosynnema sp. ALI-1.44]
MTQIPVPPMDVAASPSHLALARPSTTRARDVHSKPSAEPTTDTPYARTAVTTSKLKPCIASALPNERHSLKQLDSGAKYSPAGGVDKGHAKSS